MIIINFSNIGIKTFRNPTGIASADIPYTYANTNTKKLTRNSTDRVPHILPELSNMNNWNSKDQHFVVPSEPAHPNFDKFKSAHYNYLDQKSNSYSLDEPLIKTRRSTEDPH
jgi:hypothetical protein